VPWRAVNAARGESGMIRRTAAVPETLALDAIGRLRRLTRIGQTEP
jgi:hypothetical protein